VAAAHAEQCRGDRRAGRRSDYRSTAAAATRGGIRARRVRRPLSLLQRSASAGTSGDLLPALWPEPDDSALPSLRDRARPFLEVLHHLRARRLTGAIVTRR